MAGQAVTEPSLPPGGTQVGHPQRMPTRAVRALPGRVTAVLHAVVVVRAARVPPQVVQPVVRRVPVVVAPLHALRRRANEGKEDEPVHALDIGIRQVDVQVAGLVTPSPFENRSLASSTSPVAVIDDAVDAADAAEI